MSKPYEGFHVYGKNSAFKFEIVSNSSNVPVVSIDAAPMVNGSADWQLKFSFQVTPAEHIEFLCFLLGLVPQFKAQFHGHNRDKSLALVNQVDRGSLYIKLWNAGTPIGGELSAGNAFHLGALALKVLSLQTGLDAQTSLAVLRGTAGRLFSTVKK